MGAEIEHYFAIRSKRKVKSFDGEDAFYVPNLSELVLFSPY
jgi:hypothetical protein